MLAPLVFLILAVIAGVYGFTGKALAAALVAKILFFVCLVLFAFTLFTGVKKRKSKGS
jgi:uncharacterized membrane protein YtjA (UPF0391 family)